MKHFLSLYPLIRVAFLTVLPLVPFANNALGASATPAYVQGNYATPQDPQTTVSVPYAGAQTAGHLNVVIVGWNDSTATSPL
jgi:C1A family cysteine protease